MNVNSGMNRLSQILRERKCMSILHRTENTECVIIVYILLGPKKNLGNIFWLHSPNSVSRSHKVSLHRNKTREEKSDLKTVAHTCSIVCNLLC